MITLHAFSSMFPGGVGETKDMRVQWALEEMGLTYRVRGWDYLAGECDSDAFRAISPFGQIPVIEDDTAEGRIVIAESGAALLHLAERSGRLLPADPVGRAEVIQWAFAALATVMPTLSMTSMYDAGFMGQDPEARGFLERITHRWLGGLERRLAGEGTPREWIAGDFSIADILLATVLREARDNGLMDGFPGVRAYYERALARPAWRKTRELTAARMGVDLSAVG